MPAAAEIRIERLTKHFGSGTERLTVIDGVSLTAAPNEFVVLVGPSGCGKSTLLRLVAALEEADAGLIRVAREEPDPERQRIGFVFQTSSLLPWRTIERNVAFGLEALDLPAAEQRRRVAELLQLVELSSFAGYYPYQVSGGMQQRAAVARAFAIEPEVLLMDEPFGSLDVQMRATLQVELLRLWERLRTTVLFVTHDVEEAALLADRVVVFTPRPAAIRDIVGIDLPRPRDPLSGELLEVRRRIHKLLHGELV